MFRLRALSAIVLLPLVIISILKLPSLYVAIASGLVFALATWEWLSMIVLKNIYIRVFLLLTLIFVAYSVLSTGLAIHWIYWLSLVWWICGFIGICYYPRGNKIWSQTLLQPFIGLIMFVPAWVAFNQLHATPQGPIWVLLGCCLIWGADIGAYCTGKLLGKAKLVEKVSPGKTWAGLYGALVTGCLIMAVFYYFFEPKFSLLYAMWLAVLTLLFSVIGDLVESLIKRVYGVKDSGTLIPGHGGVFDRIDSMLAAFPIYVLGLQIIQNLRIICQ